MQDPVRVTCPVWSFAGSPSSMCSLRSSLLITFLVCTIVLAAQVTIADAGPDQELCVPNTFLEANAVAGAEMGTWTLISGALTIIDPNDPLSEVVDVAYGMNVLQWTITDGTETTSDLVQITLYEVDFPPADAGPDQIVYSPPGFAQLQATPAIFPAVCQWTIVAGTGVLTDPTDPFAMYVGATIGPNVLQWTCDYSPCGITSDQVVITVDEAMALGWLPAEANGRIAFDPHTGRLSVAAPRNIDRLILTDQMGRVVLDRSMSVRSASLDVSQLPIGAYVVRAMMDGTPFTGRFIVVR